jgi:hypothetical protein
MRRIIIPLVVLVFTGCVAGSSKKKQSEPEKKETIYTNAEGKGPEISLEFYKGKAFYYPLMAVWLEDESGNYIQSLFVPSSVATGIFKFGKQENNEWTPGPKRAPQTLPYWAHKRGVVAPDGLFMPDPQNKIADAYSGATPVMSFVLNTRADKELPEVFRILIEVNQNWDWNEYWSNDKYPDDENYKMSCQPAIVYEAVVKSNDILRRSPMKIIGHSHYSGKTGELFADLSTLTTALNIADSIVVTVK